MSTAIHIQNLGKKYKLGQKGKVGSAHNYVALRDVLADGARALGRGLLKPHKMLARPAREEFWALKDINLEIEQGDKLAIIGHNGAGKSTLLKILSRITEPTTGRIELYGRVASLLEVGTGFHPELTGRENIYLNGSILGMTHAEVRRKFDEIVDFSGVEQFLDTPVKRFSSGMRMRLGFAVAAHLESEILIIDEVLAVGDAAFQKKCIGKMDEVSKSEGRTILFVSHNMGAIQQLCNKGVVLNKGEMKYNGDLSGAVRLYSEFIAIDESSGVWEADEEFIRDNENEYLDLLKMEFRNADGEAALSPFMNDQLPELHITLNIKKPDVELGYMLYDSLGRLIYVTSSLDRGEQKDPLTDKTGKIDIVTPLPCRFLNEGTYTIRPFAYIRGQRVCFLHPSRNPSLPVLGLEISGGLSDSPYYVLKREGVMAPILEWKEQKN